MMARTLATNVEADALYFMREIENEQLIKQLNNLRNMLHIQLVVFLGLLLQRPEHHQQEG